MNKTIFTSDIFLYDEYNPFNKLIIDIITNLVESGFKVQRTIAISKNNTQSKYFNNSIQYKYVLKSLVKKNKFATRYLSDIYTAFKIGFRILFSKNVDLIIEDITHASFIIVFFSKLKRKKVVGLVQDIWPKNAILTGRINEKSFLYKLMMILQKFVYRNLNNVICISEDMKKQIISFGVKSEKISIIYNWGISDICCDIVKENNIFSEKYLINKDKFYVVYAGNLGEMQDIETILIVAKNLIIYPDIVFYIIGTGTKIDKLKKIRDNENLINVEFLPFQPLEMVPFIYSFGDVNLLPLRKGVIKTAFPSKISQLISYSQNIIFGVDLDSEFANLVSLNDLGYLVEPNDSAGYTKVILDLFQGKIKTIHKNYDFYIKYFSRNNIQEYSKIIKKAVGEV